VGKDETATGSKSKTGFSSVLSILFCFSVYIPLGQPIQELRPWFYQYYSIFIFH
jgi:hypothetical protein